MSPSSTLTFVTNNKPPRFPTRRRPSGAGSNPSRQPPSWSAKPAEVTNLCSSPWHTPPGVPLPASTPGRFVTLPKPKARLAKTDKIDAQILVAFAETFHPEPLGLPDPLQQALAALVKHRAHLLTQITQNNNLAETLADKKLLSLVARTVAFLRKQVHQLETLMAGKISPSPQLAAKARRLQQVQGIGSLSATALIALMPELGKLTTQTAAALAGVAPYNRDSGGQSGVRRINGGRAAVRCALYMATLSAVRHDRILKEFYLRLRTAGKKPLVAMTACMRKLVILMNRLLKNYDFQLATY